MSSCVKGRLTEVRICTVQFLASSKASSPALSAASVGAMRSSESGRIDRMGVPVRESLILRRSGKGDCSVRHDLGSASRQCSMRVAPSATAVLQGSSYRARRRPMFARSPSSVSRRSEPISRNLVSVSAIGALRHLLPLGVERGPWIVGTAGSQRERRERHGEGSRQERPKPAGARVAASAAGSDRSSGGCALPWPSGSTRGRRWPRRHRAAAQPRGRRPGEQGDVAAEALRDELAMVRAHRDHRYGSLQHVSRQGPPPVAADVNAARIEVCRDHGIDRASEVFRPGGRHSHAIAVAKHLPERVFGRQAAKYVTGTDEQNLSHGRSFSHGPTGLDDIGRR